MTLEILCEEFRIADNIKLQKKQQKRSKRKARRQIKTNEINTYIFLSTSDVNIFRVKY